ncbi:MAG: hypothetical protein PUP93_12610 [Rhizonema sp. NSF051]|nr:hypothetical protein [Rhizonema sp. NSF051]
MNPLYENKMSCQKIGLILSFAIGIIANNITKANALDFSFSFNNGDGNIGGSVTGIIKGLQNNGSPSSASEVDLTSYPSGLGTNANTSGNLVYLSSGGGWGTPSANSFTVTNGNLTNADFYTTGASGSFLALNQSLIAAGVNVAGLGLSVSALPSNRLTFGNTSPIQVGGLTVGQIINNTGNNSVFTEANYAAVPFEFSPSEGIALGVPLFFGLRMLKRKKALRNLSE